ncbi:hypothetical protein ABZ371_13475 [Streptomyces sp. NPDC005899]
MSATELDRFRELLQHPDFVVNSYPLISVRGRRPQGGARREGAR